MADAIRLARVGYAGRNAKASLPAYADAFI